MVTKKPALAVTFDFGQTLASLDIAMLARRLSERGISADPDALARALPLAFRAYNQAIHEGLGGHPWHLFMARVLEAGGVRGERIPEIVEWLWTEQPHNNLWRRPIPGMFELVRRLSAEGVPLGILSNSEGRLAELVEELGIAGAFRVIADSGRLGVAKPDRAIFEWTAARLGVPADAVVHVGDALAADVEGALAVGMRVIWFGGDPAAAARLAPHVRVAAEAHEVEAALAGWLARPRASV